MWLHKLFLFLFNFLSLCFHSRPKCVMCLIPWWFYHFKTTSHVQQAHQNQFNLTNLHFIHFGPGRYFEKKKIKLLFDRTTEIKIKLRHISFYNINIQDNCWQDKFLFFSLSSPLLDLFVLFRRWNKRRNYVKFKAIVELAVLLNKKKNQAADWKGKKKSNRFF